MTSQALNRPVDVIGVLDAAGANPYAEEGSPAWNLARLGAVVAELAHAASNYYIGYCQDEAAEDGPEFTGCSQAQHLAARRLLDAVSAVKVTP